MPWLKLDDSFPDHPKLLDLSDSAKWFHVRMMCYCAKYRTRGEVTPSMVKALGGKPAWVAQLEEAALWDTTSRGGWAIHDFEVYNPPPRAGSDEELRLQRAAAGRVGGQRSGEVRRSKPEANLLPASEAKPEANLVGASEAPSRPPVSKETVGADAPKRSRNRAITEADYVRWEGAYPAVDIRAMVKDYDNWKGSANHHDKVLGFENQLRESWRREKFSKQAVGVGQNVNAIHQRNLDLERIAWERKNPGVPFEQ